MWLDPLRYEVVDDQMAEVLRQKTPEEKLKLVDGMWRRACDLVFDIVKHQHPQWTEQEVRAETARRLLGGPA